MVSLSLNSIQNDTGPQNTQSIFDSVRLASEQLKSSVILKPYLPIQEPAEIDRLSEKIYSQLSRYPYYSLVRAEQLGCDNDFTHHLLEYVCRSVYRHKQQTPPERSRISFTRVCINPNSVHERGQVTRLSRTHKEMRLHTDSSYDRIPHALLLFQMIKNDPYGGMTRLMPLDDVIKELSDSMFERLNASRFSFGRHEFSVLDEINDKPMIRYYREQMEVGGKLDEQAHDVINHLDKVLNNTEKQIHLRMQNGDLLFLNNHRILHGRSGFNRQSSRLVHRYRVDLPTI